MVFFLADETLNDVERGLMASTLWNTDRSEEFKPIPVVSSLKEVKMLKEELWPQDGSLPSLSSLISPRIWMLFHYLELSTWKECATYNKFKSTVIGEEVVQDFINSNYDQEELQNILIAVSDSRKRRSRKCTKKSLKNYQKYQGPVI